MFNRILTVLALLGALAAGAATGAAVAPSAPALALQVERVDSIDGGKAYQIASSGTVAAAPAVVWRILTDYNRMADYVPDMKSARVVSRNGEKVIIDQLGAVRFLFFSRDIHLVVQVVEQAPHRIDVSLIEGDMKIYRCTWELEASAGGGTRVIYNATIEPKFYVPGMVEASLVRRDIARMMAAVLARLDRDD